MATKKAKAKVTPAGTTGTSRRSADFRVIYSNGLKASSSPVDVRLTFSHIIDNVGTNSGFVNEEAVCICVNPAVMRVMISQMEALLENHEKLWGKIVVPPGMSPADMPAEPDA